jgi:hypothetical protein
MPRRKPVPQKKKNPGQRSPVVSRAVGLNLKTIDDGKILTQGRFGCISPAAIARGVGAQAWRWNAKAQLPGLQRMPIGFYELPRRHPCQHALPRCPAPENDKVFVAGSYPCREAHGNFETMDEWLDYVSSRASQIRAAPYPKAHRTSLILAARLEAQMGATRPKSLSPVHRVHFAE